MKEKTNLLEEGATALIGMIHVEALPGTTLYKGDDRFIIEKAKEEAYIYKEAGYDGLILENMFDIPYLNREVGPEITAFMTRLSLEVRSIFDGVCGTQVLAGANKAALAVAKAAQLDFIRAEGFVFSHVADEGLMNSDAGELLRYRKSISAENIQVFTDIKKKHSAHSITSDVSIAETAKAAEFFLSDGIIITGSSTGKAADLEELKAVKLKTALPVLIGSGITVDNIRAYASFADGLIVGSYVKKDGYWKNELDPKRVSALVAQLKKAP